MWPFKPTKGAPNWRKIHQGNYDQMVKEKGWVEPKSAAPVQCFAQDTDVKPKLPEKTEWERFYLRRAELIGKVQMYRLRDRFPEVWDEWNRRWSVNCSNKEHPNWDDPPWLDLKIEPLVAERQVRKHMPDEMRDERYRGWGETELMAAFGDVLTPRDR